MEDVDDARDCNLEEKSAKKHRKKKSRRHSSSDHHDRGRSSSGDDDDDAAREVKTKSKKKDKKKRKHRSVEMEDDNNSNDDDASKKDLRKQMKREKRRIKRQKKEEEEMDEKIVASSAIEYYPDDLRRHYAQQSSSSPTKKEKGMKEKESSIVSSSTDDATVDNENCVESSGATTDAPMKTKEGDEQTTTTTTTTTTNNSNNNNVTLLLFYQYVEPPWDESQYKYAYNYATDEANSRNITGRMRIAKEGMNCTLTGSYTSIREWCSIMRSFDGGRPSLDPMTNTVMTEFANTEFKLTDDLPFKQRFPKLHAFEVPELVNYGLAGNRAPPLSKYGGIHLEPNDYHAKMLESNTVIIDVRNHYENRIGHFDPPSGGAILIDPKMRKSTEFPLWLDKQETKELLRDKQVLMYCTGGVRCERASALLKQKIDEDEDMNKLGIKGVFQLQGGVDKYFKEYPTGGMWKGKNYVFDKRFAHAPPAVEAVKRTKQVLGDELLVDRKVKCDTMSTATTSDAIDEIMGKCEACSKPWDMYRGKRRCPTCGVPSLICRECFDADKSGTKKLGKQIRCDLCVAENIRSNTEMRRREERELMEYESKLLEKIISSRKPKPNPDCITRLFIKNMCAKQMDEKTLLDTLYPAIVTHIQWLTDRNTGKFYGSAFIEVQSAEDAGSVLSLDGVMVLGRKIAVKYQRADEKDIWPIPNTEVKRQAKHKL